MLTIQHPKKKKNVNKMIGQLGDKLMRTKISEKRYVILENANIKHFEKENVNKILGHESTCLHNKSYTI